MTDMASLVQAITDRTGFASNIGMRVLHASPGQVDFAVDRREDLLQFSGQIHGGIIAGLADHAAGAAVTTALPEGRIAVTIDLNVSYLSAADGAQLIARAKALRVGRTICTASVEVVGPDADGERLVAVATVNLRVVDFAG